MELDQALHERGLRKKDLASALDLYPSAYSALTNLVFKEIISIRPMEDGKNREGIRKAFSKANNVSEKRVRREIAGYINTLEKLHRETKRQTAPAIHSFTERLIQQSPRKVLRALTGVYDCYFISSTQYEVKREPLHIHLNHKGQFVVQKGNALSSSIFKGPVFLSNPYLLTFQLQELGVVHADHFFVHFRLTASSPLKIRLLKGLAVSMSNANFPISSKLILEKRKGQISEEEFNQLETRFFPPGSKSYPSEIISYLYHVPSMIEYLPVPHPTFDKFDLHKELEIKKVMEE